MRIYFLVILVFALSLPVSAQQSPQPTCTTVEVNQAIMSLMSEISLMQVSALENNIDAVMLSISSMRAQLDALETTCNGDEPATTNTETALEFVGQGARVIGPITIPEGVYRIAADFTADSSLAIGSANIQKLSGECGLEFSDVTPLFISQGGREETVFRSSGCEALLEMAGTMSWRIVFEKVG
jgi:hypothetical protein